MKQHQVITPKQFENIVIEEVNRYYDFKYLKDDRVARIIHEYKEATEQQLKEEIHELFFKSFAEVIANIKNTPLVEFNSPKTGKTQQGYVSYVKTMDALAKRGNIDFGINTKVSKGLAKLERKENEMHITWYDTCYEIKWYDAHRSNEPHRKQVFERLTNYRIPYDIIEKEEKDVRIDHKRYKIYFYGLTFPEIDPKTIDYNDKVAVSKMFARKDNKITRFDFVPYNMDLTARIKLIVEHVLFKHIQKPMIDAARNAKPLTEEEKHVIDEKGRQWYRWDYYPLLKRLTNEYMDSFRHDERCIWRPRLEQKEDHVEIESNWLVC